MIHVLDLGFLGQEKTIAAFLVETSEGPVLIESGPYSVFSNLKKAVENVGFKIEDIQHVFLTHIHFDHAGAAWALAALGAKIYVHPFGIKHLHQPTKLYESARRIYKDKMDTLWGAMETIPMDLLQSTANEDSFQIGNATFKGWHTPGHAVHHIAWQLNEDTLFAGDVAGVKINKGMVVPPCPPPDIHIENWKNSINILRSLPLKKIYLTHFDAVTNIDEHLNALEFILDDWSQWMKSKWEAGLSLEAITPLFQAYADQQLRDFGISEAGIAQYNAANPAWMSVAGLVRYWKKKQANT